MNKKRTQTVRGNFIQDYKINIVYNTSTIELMYKYLCILFDFILNHFFLFERNHQLFQVQKDTIQFKYKFTFLSHIV